jgi:hypothetical protein
MRHQQPPSNQTSEPTSPPISPLRRRIIDDMTIRSMSPATHRSNLHAEKGYCKHFKRSPQRMGLEDVRANQIHLISKGIASRPARLRQDGDIEPDRLRVTLVLRHHAGPGRGA